MNSLVGAVRSAQTQDLTMISEILQDFQDDWSRQVAWVRVSASSRYTES